MCAHMHVSVFTHTCIHISVHVYLHRYTHMHVYTCPHPHICMAHGTDAVKGHLHLFHVILILEADIMTALNLIVIMLLMLI